MNSLAIETILEAVAIISYFPADLKVLREQKRIFNEYVNMLITAAEDREASPSQTMDEVARGKT